MDCFRPVYRQGRRGSRWQGFSEAERHSTMKAHGIVEVNPIGIHRRWSQVVGPEVGIGPFGPGASPAEVGIGPFGPEASPVEVDTGPFGWAACLVEEDTGPFGWAACLVEEDIDLEEGFVVAERPWRSVEALQEEVHLLVLGPFPVVDELPRQRRRRSFDHRSLLGRRVQQSLCWRNCQHVRFPALHRTLDKKYCRRE